MPFIGERIEWELSRPKFEEKDPPLDLHLTVRSREQSVAWSN